MERESVNGVMVDDQVPGDPIHGDILEAILSHVPLIHLVPASHVSKSWNRAVLSSLRHLNPLKPWLILHAQSSRPPYAATARAYDPRSHVWIDIEQPSIGWASPLRSSNSSLLYVLSPSKLSFSSDPLHLTWHHADAPLAWRTDPIVALVGRRVIVAGGKCDFEDDPLSVEIYDPETRTWDTFESMPVVLKDSASSTWLSVASDNRRLFVTEKTLRCDARVGSGDQELAWTVLSAPRLIRVLPCRCLSRRPSDFGRTDWRRRKRARSETVGSEFRKLRARSDGRDASVAH